MMIRCDVLVIGAGPGGLAAAKGAREAGAERVIVLERDKCAGGILNQCIHDGFGLIRYRKRLTGPEYAARALTEALESGAEIICSCQVTDIAPAGPQVIVTAVSSNGLKKFCAGSVVMALGCRERTRGAISIPGSRPAGVFTAGVIQNFVNLKNIMPGRRVVILGSGDVGMIMARRLTLEGASVAAVVEVLPEPAGLARNVSQCLYDFGIPIMCSHTVSRIIGKKKLEAVEISQLDQDMKPVPGTQQIIECDALVLSVGLIPENEIAAGAGVGLDARTNGALTDPHLRTNVPGIFSCGNSRRIMDLADFVSEQGEMAGHNAALYAAGESAGWNNDTGKMLSWDEARSTSLKKGFPEPDTVTCSICPNGCQVKRVIDDDGSDPPSYHYEGNLCMRGAGFAEQERKRPKRMLTTTVKGPDGQLIPVRTKQAVAKEILADAVAQLREFRLDAEPADPVDHGAAAEPVRCGDILTYITDSDGSRVPVIATRDIAR